MATLEKCLAYVDESISANFSIFRGGGLWVEAAVRAVCAGVAQFPRWRAGRLPVDGPIYHGL